MGRWEALNEFTARTAALVRDHDLGAEMLIVAEHEDGSGRRVEAHRALQVTDQDRRTGMATHCVVDDEGATYYGAIHTWSVSDRQVVITLTPDAAAALGTDGYRIRLEGPSARSDVIEAGLSAIAGDATRDDGA
jgi:hypothetical protein